MLAWRALFKGPLSWLEEVAKNKGKSLIYLGNHKKEPPQISC